MSVVYMTLFNLNGYIINMETINHCLAAVKRQFNEV